jgi:hypothetical protein
MHSPTCAGAAAFAVFVAVFSGPAAAQTPSASPASSTPPASTLPLFVGNSPLIPGWTLSFAPYAWAPTITGKVNAPIPGGGVATTDINVPFRDYIPDLRFGAVFAGAARYDRFSITTDFLYMNMGVSVGAAHLSSISLASGRIEVPTSLQLSDSVGMGTTLWTTAAGYTVAAGPWGNIDLIGGVRLLGINVQNNYTLNAAIVLPNKTVALARTGSLSINSDNWEAIGGVTGRFEIPNSNFFVPFYFDVGTGDLPLTWQAFSGIGYHASWADLSLGYRYLAFENKGGAAVENLQLGGVMAGAVIHF